MYLYLAVRNKGRECAFKNFLDLAPCGPLIINPHTLHTQRERETFYQKSLNPRRGGKEAEIQVCKQRWPFQSQLVGF